MRTFHSLNEEATLEDDDVVIYFVVAGSVMQENPLMLTTHFPKSHEISKNANNRSVGIVVVEDVEYLPEDLKESYQLMPVMTTLGQLKEDMYDNLESSDLVENPIQGLCLVGPRKKIVDVWYGE